MIVNCNITIIGNGSASPHKLRNPTSQYLQMQHEYWLIDCGEGTQFRMLQLGVKRSKLTGIVISHLHGDHYFGLFGLLSSLAMDKRTKPLIIIGPSKLQEMVEMHLTQGGYQLGYSINFISTDGITEKTTVYTNGFISIDSFPLVHRIPCAGYRFNYEQAVFHLNPEKIEEANIPQNYFSELSKGKDYVNEQGTVYTNAEFTTIEHHNKSYAYCSDTAYSEKISDFIDAVDLLYHEATFLEDKLKRASETFHSTAIQAATIAKKAKVGKLLLGHFSSRYDELDEFLNQALTIFGSTELSEYGKTYEF